MAKKKALLGVVCLAMVALIAVFGTVAYLTDRDAETNVFTSGDVSIDLTEDFVQNSALLPGVEIKKEVTITNDGKNDAWVWYTYAIPENIASLVDISGNDNWDTEKIAPVTETIDGVSYKVYTCVLNDALTVDTVVKGMTSVKLDPTVDYYNGKYYTVVGGVATEVAETDLSDVKIIVTAYAIQKDESINSVKAGYVAFCDQWGKVNNWPKTWDGTANTSWYNETDTEFEITTTEQLAGFAKLVDDGNNFAGKTIKLGKDLDLYAVDENGNRINFNPIGHSANGKSFNGTFDGQGHTISNLYQQSNLDSNNGGWLYEGEYYGLFAYTNGAEIKNVTVADAYISSGRNEAAGVVGNAEKTKFSDITVSGTTLIAYNNSAGGVAAECYGDCSFTNITVDEETVIGPLWGTYDVRLGGVVGLVHAGNKVTISNANISCKLDAINDVAANYQYWLYRYCGMIIGHVDGVNGVADPTGYVTCENVTVNYGDWVDYHYCEFESLGAGSYNGPGEYKYARVEAGTGTDGIDLTTCNHDADESHNVLITFDQLFGGGQGVKGLAAYNGVTVNYNK